MAGNLVVQEEMGWMVGSRLVGLSKPLVSWEDMLDVKVEARGRWGYVEAVMQGWRGKLGILETER
jgi:hypothetical protein